ncbi:hypothetical protein OAT97_00145 [Gammaproteobacteria bacterium]|nr:hypothetical protein [Gammaproteobacteria bacterium]
MPQHNIITTEDDDNCLVLTITDEDASQDEDTPIDNSYNIFSWEFITAATEQKTTVADCLKKLEDVLNNQLPNGAGNPIHIKFDLNNTNNEVSIIEQQGSFPMTAYVNSKTTRVN